MTLLRAAAARIAVLAVSFGLVTGVNRLIFARVGEGGFGFVSLIVTFSALLPFADLGLGSAIMTELADPLAETSRNTRLVRRVNSLLTVSAIVLTVCSVVLFATGAWPVLLGARGTGNDFVAGAALLTMLCFAVSVRLASGYRILVAVGRTSAATLCQAISPFVALAIAGMSTAWSLPTVLLVCAVPIGNACASGLTAIVAGRVGGFSVVSAVWPFWRSGPNDVRLRGYSLPMILTSVATPIAYQSDRLLLAQFGSVAGLSAYSVVAQVYAPLYGVLQTASTPLWPRLGQLRLRSDPGIYGVWLRGLLVIALVSVGVAAFLILGAPEYAMLIGARSSFTVTAVDLLFGALLVAQGIANAVFAGFSTASGIAAQARLSVLAAVVNIALTVWLIGHIDARGPLVGSLVAVVFCQIIPLAVLEVRRVALVRAEAALPRVIRRRG